MMYITESEITYNEYICMYIHLCKHHEPLITTVEWKCPFMIMIPFKYNIKYNIYENLTITNHQRFLNVHDVVTIRSRC